MKLMNVLTVMTMVLVIASPGTLGTVGAQEGKGEAEARSDEWRPIETEVVWPTDGMDERENASRLIDHVLQAFEFEGTVSDTVHSNRFELRSHEGLDVEWEYEDGGLRYIKGKKWEWIRPQGLGFRPHNEFSENSSLVARVLVSSLRLLDELGIVYDETMNLSVTEGKFTYVKFWRLVEDTPVGGANFASLYFHKNTHELVGFTLLPWITLNSTVDHELAKHKARAVTYKEVNKTMDEHPYLDVADLSDSYAGHGGYYYAPDGYLDLYYWYGLMNGNSTIACHADIMIDGATGETEVVEWLYSDDFGKSRRVLVEGEDRGPTTALTILSVLVVLSLLAFLGGWRRERSF